MKEDQRRDAFGQIRHLRVVPATAIAFPAVEEEPRAGWTPLMIAAAAGATSEVERLIASHAEINCANSNGITALICAVAYGHTAVVERLIANHAEIDHADDHGRTALTLAAAYGHTAVVELLIANHAKIDHANFEGRTALMTAAAFGHTAVVELLIANHAEIDDTISVGGWTALMFAAAYGHTAVVEVLITNHAEIDRMDRYDDTPLSIAAREGHTAVVGLLIANHAEIDQANRSGWTPLMSAAAEGYTAIVELLIANHAEIDRANFVSEDFAGWTALMFAAAYGHTAVVGLLIANHAKIDRTDRHGSTPLMRAIEGGNAAVVEILITKGNADIEITDNDGNTALDKARECENHDIEIILKNCKYVEAFPSSQAAASSRQQPAMEDTNNITINQRSALSSFVKNLSLAQIVAIVEDSTLGRQFQRYHERLASVELPPDGLKTIEQAQAAANLSASYRDLCKHLRKLKLPTLPKDERVVEAERQSEAFYRKAREEMAVSQVRSRRRANSSPSF